MMSRKGGKPVFFVLFFILVVILLVGTFVGYFIMKAWVNEQFGNPAATLGLSGRVLYPLELFINRNKLIAATDPGGAEKLFEIAQGESVAMVCLRLAQEGLIADSEAFRIYLVYSGLDRFLQAGRFRLSSQMTPLEIADQLMDATPTEAAFTILAGWRIEEIAANIATSGLPISEEAFINAAYNPSSYHLSFLLIADVDSLEGFLFPGSYIISREADIDAVIEMVLSAFTDKVDEKLLEGFIRQGLSMDEAVTLASIVEKEAIIDDEKPMIASVFYNRLAIGMRLETDPTVQYGLGYNPSTQSWWKSPLTISDLAVNSAYNTYLITGLPPTPICNPDLGSLRAVAFPAETPYFYFRAACDGSGRHNFAITFEEHVNNQCE
jgi:UPF0755 protein